MNKRIRELRKLKGLNQTEFGEKIGVTQKPVSEMERDGGSVTERNFNAICKAFNVNPDWLRYGVGEIFIETREALIQTLSAEYELTAGETLLLKTFLDLPPEHRQGVLTFARNFATSLTTASQLGIEYQPRKADDELTRAERHAVLDAELDAVEAAQKKEIITSSASIGTNGASKKNSNRA